MDYPAQSLEDLISEDITSYEYFNSLPEEVKKSARREDPVTFEALQAFVAREYGIGRS